MVLSIIGPRSTPTHRKLGVRGPSDYKMPFEDVPLQPPSGIGSHTHGQTKIPVAES